MADDRSDEAGKAARAMAGLVARIGKADPLALARASQRMIPHMVALGAEIVSLEPHAATF